MTLDALRVALQGLFPLTPIAAAVQGLVVGDAPPPPPTEAVYRPPIVGRGPGTTINASDYLAHLRRRSAPAPAQPQPAHLTRRRRQRRNMQALRLAALVLE